MTTQRILIANHAAPALQGLEQALIDEGLEVRTSANMAATWAQAREWDPDAVILSPLDLDPGGTEIRSLLQLAADPEGPAVLVITEDPRVLEQHARTLDDFLPPHLDPPAVLRRLRFAVARREALSRLATEREALLQQTITDFKTGLFNDRYFHTRCKEECSRAQRQDQHLGVLMIDFDDFKAINDEHDHSFGDHVLLGFARTMRSRLRDFDVPARLGGDEFAVLLPSTRLSDAASIAQRLCDSLAEMTFSDGDHSTRLTVSIGVASWNPGGKRTFDEEFKGADRALLRAKKAGRGGIWTFDGRSRAYTPKNGPKTPSSKGR